MYIGIDLGTSGVKTILIDENQKTICSHTESIKIQNPYPGYFEQDPEDWYFATIKSLNKIKESKKKEFSSVKSIGISGQMHGSTLIDNNHKVIRPCILWNDTRSVEQCIQMEKKYKNLREESGNIAMPGFTSPKILWIKENEYENFKRINKILLPKDYLRLKLSGDYFTDMSDASGTLWLDVKNRNWSENLLNLTYLSKNNMPDLAEGSDATSKIKRELSKKLGFENEVIIAGGAGDQAAGAVGSGVINSSESVISLGTSGVYFSPTDKFISNTNQAVHSFCHCIPETWHHMSVMLSATQCLDWISKLFNLTVQESINKIESLMNNKFDFGSSPYFLPYLNGERTPYNNAYLRGSFHNLNTSSNIDEILYSVVEGVCFGIKDGYEAVHSVSPISKNTYLVGGGSKSDVWSKLLASTLNRPIIIGEDADLGPALGVARLAMLATKDFKKKEVIKGMKTLKISDISKNLSDILQKRYYIWKKIVYENEPIAKSIME